MDCECHVACLVCENCVILQRHVIKELLAQCHGPFRWFCLLGCERAECREKAAVDTACEEKEYTANLLDKLLSCLVEGGGIIVGSGVLFLGSIIGFDMWVWLVLWFAGGGVLETRECFGHVI